MLVGSGTAPGDQPPNLSPYSDHLDNVRCQHDHWPGVDGCRLLQRKPWETGCGPSGT